MAYTSGPTQKKALKILQALKPLVSFNGEANSLWPQNSFYCHSDEKKARMIFSFAENTVSFFHHEKMVIIKTSSQL